MRCCGENRTTRFCSTCGKQLLEDKPLFSLLNHCRRTANMLKQRGKSHSNGYDKWTDWAEELEKLLIKQGGGIGIR